MAAKVPRKRNCRPSRKVEELIDLIEASDEEGATRLVCEIGSISEATARRILADRQGEPLVVMLKALGLPRGRLQGVLERLQVCNPPRIASDRVPGELQAIFDTLSLTKTRVLLDLLGLGSADRGALGRQRLLPR